jgi:two-component system, cell cycle response regulator DivK
VTTILIVEDNEMNMDMLSRRLAKRGYEILMATDGQAGINTAIAQRPNLILMDMSLPVMDGWEATRQLRAQPEMQTVPIIALTAHALSEDRDKCLAAGCNDYESKPIKMDTLLAKIESWLAKASESN